MKLAKQVEIAKSMGFKFGKIHMKWNRAEGFQTGCVEMIYGNELYGYHNSNVVLKKSWNKKQLIEGLTNCIKSHEMNIERYKSRAERRRREGLKKTIKVIHGGMEWVPNGLTVGIPVGKLKLVA